MEQMQREMERMQAQFEAEIERLWRQVRDQIEEGEVIEAIKVPVRVRGKEGANDARKG